ncbi:MAG: hypothetical protein HKM04_06800, partial [Legionellales bacterium]|nr:hypothetical protein [Legionellales bacterium]
MTFIIEYKPKQYTDSQPKLAIEQLNQLYDSLCAFYSQVKRPESENLFIYSNEEITWTNIEDARLLIKVELNYGKDFVNKILNVDENFFSISDDVKILDFLDIYINAVNFSVNNLQQLDSYFEKCISDEVTNDGDIDNKNKNIWFISKKIDLFFEFLKLSALDHESGSWERFLCGFFDYALNFTSNEFEHFQKINNCFEQFKVYYYMV